ncbi:MAG: YdjY domain-containing protein, partial [Planctomycetaceae bacterium]
AGSFFYEDEDHPRFYTAEAGYVVCVANLPEALVDVSIPSSSSNGALAFETLTEKIPPEGTEVTVELIPVRPKAKKTSPPGAGQKLDGSNAVEKQFEVDAADPSSNHLQRIARRQ